MKDTLSIIQLGAQIGRIVSKVLMVVGIVASSLCVVGIISLATIGLESINLFGIDFYSIIKVESGMPVEAVYISLVTGIIMCVALAVNGGFATSFFKKEMEIGTPFDSVVVNKMFKLGIILMAVSLGSQIVSGISEKIMNIVMNLENPYSTNLEIGGSFSMGLMFFIMSFVCKLGTEQKQN